MQACADTVLAYWQPTVQGEKPSKRKQNEKTKKTKLKTKKKYSCIYRYARTVKYSTVPDQKTFSFLFFLGKIQSNRNNNAARHSNKKRVRKQLQGIKKIGISEYCVSKI